ncbi:alkaline phosphatase D family protein [Desulfogranum marinum]|uniref:alkaline phosphatase D family protein n=1 Tax=Desulfogranum marinum TaxID=453220 RepID=UPI001963B95A|nr:alkaline phosphatase D family protein [Desulfogranum marinum]MBM9513607.1 alkaline phosphatase family protein [Desulfogranum marinum]
MRRVHYPSKRHHNQPLYPMQQHADLPPIIAGPILRRVTRDQLVLWVATSSELSMSLCLYRHTDQHCFFKGDIGDFSPPPVRIGEHAYIYLIDFKPQDPFPAEELLQYDLLFHNGQEESSLVDCMSHIVYEGQSRPLFVVKPVLDHILHGSCRKPHDPSKDALLRIDNELATTVTKPEKRPALLMMTGDQIYADDVGGPMLVAIHQAAAKLGLFKEHLTGAVVADSDQLLASKFCYYKREELLPHNKETKNLRDRFFGGVRKPIFTTASAHNHLVTLAELAAMYLLIWSPALWKYVDLDSGDIPEGNREQYKTESKDVGAFAEGLGNVQRLLAHMPTYMIFDDHDVTDDWNLSRGWEEVAYEHPFSRRIIGNALIAYFLFQGWGNNPQQFEGVFLEHVHDCFHEPGGEKQDALINYLLKFEAWNYSLPTKPKMVVLDTRTNRWWSESSLTKPSGLMEWEDLSELQQELMHQPSVLLISPAPIFGVKLIEVVQRIITYCGHPLVVDAENWMAHPGSANVILNIFRHRHTPKNFVILSGDVHYSFAYDVKLRYRRNSPNIWQITCSGFKNEFPHRLLRWFDRANRWLYASRSPLNWFTRRRKMRIKARRPDNHDARQLVNESSVGRVRLNEQGEPTEISVLPGRGGEVKFYAQQ